MRVLHVIPSVATVRGGPSQAVLQLVGALNQRGVDAEIVATNDNGPELLDLPLESRIEFSGAPVWLFRRFSPNLNALREFAFSATLTKWLWRNVHRYDLVHVHAFFSYASTAAMLIARERQVPYLVRPLGLLCAWSLKQSALKKKIYLTLVERSNLNQSRGIEYTSLQELEEAAGLGLRAPSFVLPFGIDVPELLPSARQELRARIKVPHDEPVILFLSRLHPKKGLEHLLAGLEIIVHQRFSLVVAGSGSPGYEAELRCKIDKSPLKGRVHLVGFAQDQFKQVLLQGSDLFVLTSHSESFALAAMEAIAAGTPVLITQDVPLAPLVKKFHTGWVTSQQAAAIASVITSVLDAGFNTDAVRARSERCRNLAANFTWERIAARMEEVYVSVMNRRHPPSLDLGQLSVKLMAR
jgi:glycosyltransferase involved in cell wall biosynthesis